MCFAAFIFAILFKLHVTLMITQNLILDGMTT